MVLSFLNNCDLGSGTSGLPQTSDECRFLVLSIVVVPSIGREMD
jgi:hypothetical protein